MTAMLLTIPEIDFMQLRWAMWLSRGKVRCMECRKVLQFSPYHVAHILGKGAYPGFITMLDNVIPLCAEHHNQMDGGDGRKGKKDFWFWPWLEAREMMLKRLYSKLMK